MRPVAGMFADKLSRTWLTVGSPFVWSAVTLGMGYASTYEQPYVLRAVMGISEAFYIPAGLSFVADYHSDKTRSPAVGVHTTVLYMGQALGRLGATVSCHLTWQSSFALFGSIGIIYAVILIFTLFQKKYRAVKQDKERGLS